MRKLVVTEFLTLDGVFEDPGGSEKFELGGWAFGYERGAEGDKFKKEELETADISLLGAKTYDEFFKAWPQRTGEFADKLNSMAKYVVSSRPKKLDWENTKLITNDVKSQIIKLKSGNGGDILVAGSGTLANYLLENKLVDEIRLMIFPVVLGAGRKLFKEGLNKTSLKLVEIQPVGSDGVFTAIYYPLSHL